MSADARRPAPPHIPDFPPDTTDLVGVALSGGGVRSATFSLGALQALHDLGLLRAVDYLSTVSGGGFTGGWWSAWLARPARRPGEHFPSAEELEPSRFPAEVWSAAGGPAVPAPGLPGRAPARHEDPVHHLRLYANYLTPRSGLLSADTWRGITFYVRTLVFTWLALLPLLLAAIMGVQWMFVGDLLRVVGMSDPTVATTFMCSRPDAPAPPGSLLPGDKPVARGEWIDAPGCPAGAPPQHADALVARLRYALRPLAVLGVALITLSVLWLLHATAQPVGGVIGTAGALALLGWIGWRLAGTGPSDPLTFVAGVTAALIVVVHVGWVAWKARGARAVSHDAQRVMLARWQSWTLSGLAALAGALAVGGFGHELVWLLVAPGSGWLTAAAAKAGWGALLASAASAAFTAYKSLPSGRAKDSSEGVGRLSALVLRVAPYLVLAVLAALLAWVGHALVIAWHRREADLPPTATLVLAGSLFGLGFGVVEWLVDRARAGSPPVARSRATNRLVRLASYLTVVVLAATCGTRPAATALAALGTAVLAAGLAVREWMGERPARIGAPRGAATPLDTFVLTVAPYPVLLAIATLLTWYGHPAPGTLALVGAAIGLWFGCFQWARGPQPASSIVLGVLYTVAMAIAVLGGALFHPSRVVWSPRELIAWGGAAFCLGFLVEEMTAFWRSRGWTVSGRAMLLVGLAAAGFLAESPQALSVWLLDGGGAAPARIAWELLLLIVFWVVGFGWMADPNLLSMHGFYRARLVRAYLGASNPARPVDITEEAAADDLPLTALVGHSQGGPYHLVNATLNLGGARDLAAGQRPAASFVFSRYFCGSGRTGYRWTDEYMGGRPTLGTAVAISGAAASPAMGLQAPGTPLGMLMALLNVRLGAWVPNPGQARWREGQARLWPFYLLHEFLAHTTDTTSYCYLTDGGHFDNTGLYSLVERGCRYVVLVDTGADPALRFQDLGAAIRQCRIDFGAEVRLDAGDFLARDDEQLAERHVVVGTVVYHAAHWSLLGWTAATEADRTGILVWIKPMVTARDPADVRQYARENREFPQQTTMDQWYDEAQFESYRKLGYESVRSVFAEARPAPGPGRAWIAPLFTGLTTP